MRETPSEKERYVYDIFGLGINMAARMETLSEPMRITISESTFRLIKDEFVCTERELPSMR